MRHTPTGHAPTRQRPMRPTLRALALTMAALAAAPPTLSAATAAPRTQAPDPGEWTGVYRVEAVRGDQVVPMLVLVERPGERLAVTVLIDNAATALEGVQREGDALRGTLRTSHGAGELVLRAAGRGVTGTLTVGKRTWSLTGRRSV